MMSSYLPEVVLVEDTDDDEFLSRRGITHSGVACNVTVKRDGFEAVTHLTNPKAVHPSLVVLDFNLPKLNGLEVLAKIRSNDRLQCVPVVLLGGVEVERQLHHCYKSGANSCVVKPANARDYMDQVAQIVLYWLTVNRYSDNPEQPTFQSFARQSD